MDAVQLHIYDGTKFQICSMEGDVNLQFPIRPSVGRNDLKVSHKTLDKP